MDIAFNPHDMYVHIYIYTYTDNYLYNYIYIHIPINIPAYPICRISVPKSPLYVAPDEAGSPAAESLRAAGETVGTAASAGGTGEWLATQW